MDIVTQVTAPPAGGAPLAETIGLTVFAILGAGVLLALGHAHRAGRTGVIDALGRGAQGAIGGPPWAAVPNLAAAGLLIIGALGFMWDVSLHIALGRDDGPLANPSHYLILGALSLGFVAGAASLVLPGDGERPGPAPIRITRRWYAPVGAVLLTVTATYSLLGFPLDDLWHRAFGQDVTLWGPTHLMLITFGPLGAMALLTVEMESRRGAVGAGGRVRPLAKIIGLSTAGGFLVAMSVYQGEYDFGVQQYRAVLQPMLIALAASVALVAARLRFGPGAAVIAAVGFIAVRGLMVLLVGPVFGSIGHVFPLYLGCALVVEAVALLAPRLLSRPLAFGAVSGLGIATVGLLLESLWIGYAFAYPWTLDMLVEGALMAIPVGLAGGLLSGLLVLCLRGELPRPAVRRGIVVGGVGVLAVATANGLIATVPEGASAHLRLTEVPGEPGRRVMVEVRLSEQVPVDAQMTWVAIQAWQGGGSMVEPLERTGERSYRSTRPIPVDGNWKAALRLANGRTLTAATIRLPADAALGAPEVPALAEMTRPFTAETLMFQRERKAEIAGWAWNAGLAAVAVLTGLVFWLSCWGMARVSLALTARPHRSVIPSAPGSARGG